MKKATVNNSLSGFQKLLKSAKTNGIRIRSIIYNNNSLTRETDFTTIGHIQSNSFALDRDGKLSWVQYGKASTWKFNFEDNKIIKYYSPENYMIFEFDDFSFFGF